MTNTFGFHETGDVASLRSNPMNSELKKKGLEREKGRVLRNSMERNDDAMR